MLIGLTVCQSLHLIKGKENSGRLAQLARAHGRHA